MPLQKQGQYAFVLLLHGNIKPHLYGCGYESVAVQHTKKLLLITVNGYVCQ